jgi:hypothetical protein
MDNFDLKKFLVENKLTDNSKELLEYDMKKTGESIQCEFEIEGGARVKIGVDNFPRYIKRKLEEAVKEGKEEIKLTYMQIKTVPDFEITNRTDDMGRPLNQ